MEIEFNERVVIAKDYSCRQHFSNVLRTLDTYDAFTQISLLPTLFKKVLKYKEEIG